MIPGHEYRILRVSISSRGRIREIEDQIPETHQQVWKIYRPRVNAPTISRVISRVPRALKLWLSLNRPLDKRFFYVCINAIRRKMAKRLWENILINIGPILARRLRKWSMRIAATRITLSNLECRPICRPGSSRTSRLAAPEAIRGSPVRFLTSSSRQSSNSLS